MESGNKALAKALAEINGGSHTFTDAQEFGQAFVARCADYKENPTASEFENITEVFDNFLKMQFHENKAVAAATRYSVKQNQY